MNKYFVCVASVSLAFLTGCAHYQASPLSALSSVAAPAQINQIVVQAKAFSKEDCITYLDRDVLKQGYQPVQIYIQNNSNQSYLFSPVRVSLSHANPREVAATVHTSTVGRAVGYGAAALVLWPFAIPAVIDGVGSAEANKALDTDFISKAAREQTIAPYSHLNQILFVQKNDYQSTFTVTLLDATGVPLTVDVRVQ